MKSRITTTLSLMPLIVALAACGPSREEREAAARAAAQAAVEREAAEQLAGYRQALADDNVELAAAYGELIQARYGHTQAARELGEDFAAIREQAEQHKRARYLQSLWTYQTAPMGGGQQRTASLYSEELHGRRLRLVLRDHSEWGRSTFLLPPVDLFVCTGTCRVQIRFDEGPTRPFEATKADSKENPGLFIEDMRGFVTGLMAADRVTIEVPTTDGSQVYGFEVGGYDPERFAAGQ
ncbi:MAG TPA: hypothetical protein DDZ76_05810 [Xanthomonadales bacterium]|nr:hypothetical protein [Xanthomonadales bacterium]